MTGVPYRLWGVYEGLLAAFCKAVEDADGQVSEPDVPLASCFRRATASGAVEFKKSLYLKGCPSKKKPRDKRLDVVIRALEEMERGPTSDVWFLTKSKICLDYFAVSNSAALLVQSLRYDFLDGGQPAHPFFHVHVNDERIPGEELVNTGFAFEMRESPSDCWVKTRIPTPDMTLASVLYCLVADHLSGFFREFAASVDPIHDRLPRLRFDALTGSLQKSPEHFKSLHWFAHMKPKEGNS